jgi:DNA-binding transcriptional regulator YhcF (GntR family)
MTDSNTELVYKFLQSYISTNEMSPSIREVATGCFINVGTVMRHLDKLEGQGRILRDLGKARSIRLANDKSE